MVSHQAHNLKTFVRIELPQQSEKPLDKVFLLPENLYFRFSMIIFLLLSIHILQKTSCKFGNINTMSG